MTIDAEKAITKESGFTDGFGNEGWSKQKQPGKAIVKGDEYVQHDAPARRAHICCGCCCDTRKAVFVVNIISICFGLLGITWLVLFATGAVNPTYEDDEVQAEVQTALDELSGAKLGIGIAILVVSLICYTIAIYGAAKYNKTAIMVGGVWFVVEAILSLIRLDIGGAVYSGLFAYPHFVFWNEIRNGVMSPETYPNEKVCCECCGCC